MRIAEQVAKDGMKAGTAFMDFITDTIRDYSLTRIIETGSYMGTGTTAAIARGIEGMESVEVYSIEVNPEFHRIAKENNEGSPIVFVLGLSVPRPMIPIDTTFNVPDTVVVDHYPDVRAKMYRREVMQHVKDDMLRECLSLMDNRPQMVILDSAGHMGWIEFNYLMQYVKGEFILCLDDTNHVKHYDTINYCKQHPEKYELLFETDEKFGSAAFRVS